MPRDASTDQSQPGSISRRTLTVGNYNGLPAIIGTDGQSLIFTGLGLILGTPDGGAIMIDVDMTDEPAEYTVVERAYGNLVGRAVLRGTVIVDAAGKVVENGGQWEKGEPS